MSGIFYRVLPSPQHVERWRQRSFTSFHPHGPPSEWIEIAKRGGLTPEEFPSETANGVYEATAVESFVAWCRENEGQLDAMVWEKLPEDARWSMVELTGVCAFDNPEGAYWYGFEEADPQAADRFVVFRGKEVFRLRSEGNGGVQAEVVEPIGSMMTREEFVNEYWEGNTPEKPTGTPVTPEDLPGLSEDFESEDETGPMPELQRKPESE